MKRFSIFALAVLLCASAHGQGPNVNVVNPTNRPVPVRLDQTAPGTSNGISNYGYNGTTWEGLRVANASSDLNAVAIGSGATVWSSGAGTKPIRLMGGTISVSAACNVIFEDNENPGTVLFRTPKLAADTPFSFVVRGGQGVVVSAPDADLRATSSAAATITGTLYGLFEKP